MLESGSEMKLKKEDTPMKQTIVAGILAASVLATLAFAVPARAMDKMKGSAVVYTQSVVDLRNAMRQLWEEHIVYTRNFIISALAGLDDTDKIAERLLRNQDDIGNAIKPI